MSAPGLDAFDAILQHIFKQTQADAWFNPSNQISTGVCIRTDPATSTFRTFPYNNTNLTAFADAVKELNPEVAVKVRSASVQAALLNVGPNQTALFIDAEVRIQVLDTMSELVVAEKGQGAAFIRDERALVVWSDRTEDIIESVQDFEARLLSLVWVRRQSSFRTFQIPTPVGSKGAGNSPLLRSSFSNRPSVDISGAQSMRSVALQPSVAEKDEEPAEKAQADPDLAEKGLSVTQDYEERRDKRPLKLFAPVYDGLAVGLGLFFVGTGVRTLLTEWALDKDFTRFSLIVTAPFFFFVSLFFCITLIGSVSQIIGPVAQCHENSRYYSSIPPPPIASMDSGAGASGVGLPRVTIQMPVYKESLEQTIAPSVFSLQKAMLTYARQGGTSSIFICDDGMQLISEEDRAARMDFYAKHRIGWVARPPHSTEKDGFKRAGRFKKASNMNYGLAISLRMEEILLKLLAEGGQVTGANTPRISHPAATPNSPRSVENSTPGSPVIESQSLSEIPAPIAQNPFADAFAYTTDPDLEEKALRMAVEETNGEAWASGGKSIRIGEIILLIDSDTQVPEDCLRDAARELHLCPEVAIIQHESDAMLVAHHYFENAIAYFTRRVNQSISMACANGEIAPFVGHNAFLRWQAMQDAAFVDPADGKRKFWSEEHVSEDFDMAMRVQLKGYIVRWAIYSNGGFKEGVSLTCDDELNRWTKYSYGCNELLFNPIKTWFRKGPIAPQIRRFLWSNAPIHYKVSMMAYMFSYYGIGASMSLGLLNYILLGFQFHVDAFYTRGFELWLSCLVLFLGAGNVGFTVMEYRLGKKSIVDSLWENIKWLPFFFVFFGGLSLHISGALLSHLFSINITWGATKKEVERSNFFEEVPKILKRFWLTLTISILIMAGVAICATNLLPLEWRVQSDAWAVILPFAINTMCHILYPIVLNPWLMIFSY